jgi:hypothetical protein
MEVIPCSCACILMILVVMVDCEFREDYFKLTMNCVDVEWALPDILVALQGVSLLGCASLCLSNKECVSIDVCKNDTCRLRRAHVTTPCVKRSQCDHYHIRSKYTLYSSKFI